MKYPNLISSLKNIANYLDDSGQFKKADMIDYAMKVIAAPMDQLLSDHEILSQKYNGKPMAVTVRLGKHGGAHTAYKEYSMELKPHIIKSLLSQPINNAASTLVQFLHDTILGESGGADKFRDTLYNQYERNQSENDMNMAVFRTFEQAISGELDGSTLMYPTLNINIKSQDATSAG